MIAVVGATGVLGQQLVSALHDEGHPLERTVLFASAKSQGEEVDCGSDTLAIEPTDFRGVKVALVATPLTAARALVDDARKAGAQVIDFRGAFRADLGVPLVVPGVSPTPRREASVIAVAGAAGSALATLLRQQPVAWLDAVGLYAAAHRGHPGIHLLEQQTAALLSARASETNEPFAHQLAFNVIPQVGAFAKGHPQSSEELAVTLDVSRAMTPAPVVRVTALHVPTFHGLTLCLHGQLEGAADVAGLSGAFRRGERIKVLDGADEGVYPMPTLAVADDAVHVGRIRVAGNHFWCVAAVDNAAFVARGGARLALELL